MNKLYDLFTIFTKLVIIKISKFKISKAMSSFKYQVSLGAVRKANDRLISRKKVLSRTNPEYSGIITAKVYFNGVKHEQELSSEKIKEAYTSSLKKYAKKL